MATPIFEQDAHGNTSATVGMRSTAEKLHPNSYEKVHRSSLGKGCCSSSASGHWGETSERENIWDGDLGEDLIQSLDPPPIKIAAFERPRRFWDRCILHNTDERNCEQTSTSIIHRQKAYVTLRLEVTFVSSGAASNRSLRKIVEV